MSPTTHTSSSMPMANHVLRGSAPNDGTSLLTFSNMKTFMMPDAPYTRAPSAWRIQRRVFMVQIRVVEELERGWLHHLGFIGNRRTAIS